MVYYNDPNLEEDEENQESFKVSGASPTANNSGGFQSESSQNKSSSKLNTGSGFQNLDSYFKANQPQQFGSQFLGKVDEQVKGAQQAQKEGADQFKSQVEGSNLLPKEDQVKQAIEKPEEANAKEFQNWMSQTYSGPKSLSDSQSAWNQYWGKTDQAETSAKLLGSDSGRMTLLDSYFGRPNYSFGEQTLDNLLVQGAGLGKEIKNLQTQGSVLRGQGNEQARQLQGLAGQRAGEVEQSRNQVRSAIGVDDKGQVLTGGNAGAIGKQYQSVYDQLEAANKARHTEQEAFKQALASGNLTPEQLQALGVSSVSELYDLTDLNPYVTYGQDLTRDQVMSDDQRAYIRALSNLAGIQDTFATGETQEKNPLFTVDQERLTNDRNAAKVFYQQQLAASDQAIREAQEVLNMDYWDFVDKYYPDSRMGRDNKWEEAKRDNLAKLNEWTQKRNELMKKYRQI